MVSSQTAFLPHNCMGSTGGLSVASIDTPLVKTGTAASRVIGSTNAIEADAWSQNTIASASLLDGVLTVDAITAAAHARYTGGSVALDANGTLFTGVRLNGELISDGGIEQNTSLQIPGVGSATLKKVEKLGDRIEVTMIEIEITIGTDAGTTLQIGRAAAGISR